MEMAGQGKEKYTIDVLESLTDDSLALAAALGVSVGFSNGTRVSAVEKRFSLDAQESIGTAYLFGRLSARLDSLLFDENVPTVNSFPAEEILEEIGGKKNPAGYLREEVRLYLACAYKAGFTQALKDIWNDGGTAI